MTKRSWATQKIMDAYGSKRGLLRAIKFYLHGLFTRKYARYAKLPNQVTRVVFVCKGNICRSAVAEYAFRKHSSLPTASIGLDTHTGKEGNSRIIRYAQEMGIDMSAHRTTAITDFQKAEGDLYVCMEPEHVRMLQGTFKTPENTVLLGYFGKPKKLYIHDPYVAAENYARRCTSYVVKATERLALEIKTTS